MSERAGLWNDLRMIALANIAAILLGDTRRCLVLLFRPAPSLAAENLFRRRQLALYQERGLKPRRIEAATRVNLVLLARLFDWRSALVVVLCSAEIKFGHRRQG